ncbi:sulfatase [Engelhardtia mirabilis]|uniref:Choline-sulfatase n=1 Tax=Engelhardtia mirabilis TaxID=2528011 RepID=A0A518BGG9_9BACT|nr:Choline-sulfatase [Planctomycetes bacterium Pla133]QDV00383.1 Choline-sulfatase [Planctomycetes bacterium Pla86]
MRGLGAWGLAAAALAACGGSSEPSPPNVIVIVADTLRSDHLSTYGYDVATSPRLDALAARATVYETARSTAPWTLPSHASLFTGLLPLQHGAHTVAIERPGSNARGLDERAVTLAEVLGEAGYRTFGVAANGAFLKPKYGLAQGFDEWTVREEPAGQLEAQVFEFLAQPGDGPFLLFLNYMDTHRPYNSVERPGLLPRPVGRRSAQLLRDLYGPVLTGTEPRDSERLRQLIDQYDTSIANLDEALGRLFDELERLELFDDAVLVFTSDHGEYFGEHDLIEHSKDVYEPALRVPLIFKAPGQRVPARIADPISIAHVPALIFEQLGDALRATARERAPALLLGPVEAGARLVVAENYLSRSKDLFDERFGARFQRVRRVLYADGLKLIRSSDGDHELYDVRADPAEARDLYGDFARYEDVFGDTLESIVTAWPRLGAEGGAVQESAGDLERLGALGYY